MRAPSAWILLACLPLAAAAAPSVDDPALEVEQVVTDLDVPTTMAFIGANDFLVLEKNDGQVIRVLNGAKSVVLDLDVEYCEERGLLGVAVHPAFGQSMNKDWVYLYYTLSQSGDDEETCGFGYTNRLDRFRWNSGTGTLVDQENLDTFPSFVTYHLGGPLSFGPDGKLYGTNGDGEQNGGAQNDEANPMFDDTGIIFRLNEDGSTPDDNPFDDDDDQADPEDRYFAYGVRNSFGLGWDPMTGRLWDTENGENSNDEINYVPAGFNSGWRDIMGPGAAPAGLVVLPGSQYREPAYTAAIPPSFTGIAFASTNTSLPSSYEYDLFVAEYNNGQVYSFDVNMARDGVASADKLANTQNELNGFRVASGFTGGITDLEEGPDGHMYVVAIGLGEVWRIRGSGVMPSHDLAFGSLKPPKSVTFSPSPKLKPVKVTLENRGTATETIANQDQLDDLIDVSIQSLGVCPAPDWSVQPPKKGFPVTWEPGKKLSLAIDIAWACINDEAKTSKGEDHDDYSLEAMVVLGALGETDEDPSNDACPRAPAGDDKGCGKQATSFRVDLILK